MPQRQTLLIDFDGVLHNYKGWEGELSLHNPIPNARKALYLLVDKYRLICFTTRKAEIVTAWLKLHGFPEMKVTNIKEPAFLIIDDRALTFKGEWTEELMTQIKTFKPHWKEGES